MTLRHDIRHRRGDTFVSKNYAVLINGAGVTDLDDYTVKCQIRTSFDATPAIHDFTGAEIVIDSVDLNVGGTTITTNYIRLELDGAVTQTWPIIVAEWELQISHAGTVYTLVEGTFRIVRDVTR
jgi:hypothetical protein